MHTSPSRPATSVTGPRPVRDPSAARPAILLSFLVGNLGGVASFFAPSFGPFLALRLLCGVGVAGAKSSMLLRNTGNTEVELLSSTW